MCPDTPRFWQRFHDAIVDGDHHHVLTSLETYYDVITPPVNHDLTPLQLAAKHGHSDIVMTLLKHSKITTRKDRETCVEAMRLAIRHVDVIKVFVETRNIWPPKTLQSSDVEPLYTVIARAHIRGGCTETAKYLVLKYPDYKERWSELIDLAYTHGHRELVQFWLPNVNLQQRDRICWRKLHIQVVAGMPVDLVHATARYQGDSLLDVATRCGDITYMEQILQKIPAKLRQDYVNRAGVVACQSGKVESLKWLLEKGLRTRFLHEDEWRKNVLLIAARCHEYDLVSLLLKYHDRKMRSPWHKLKFKRILNRALLGSASFRCDENIIKILLEHGAQDEQGLALLNACNYGNPKSVKLLLKKHAKNHKLLKRCLATALSSEFESVPTIELLLETGNVDVNDECTVECPFHHWTPVTVALQYKMHYTPRICHAETFRLLLHRGADLWPDKDEFNSSRFLMTDHPHVRPLLHLALDHIDSADVFPNHFHFVSLPDLGPTVSWRFLPKLLERMCGSRTRVIGWNDLLMLLMLDQKCADYCRSIAECGFRIRDTGFDEIRNIEGELKLEAAYQSYVRANSIRPKSELCTNYQLSKLTTSRTMQSLKSISRVAIRRNLRANNPRRSMLEMLGSLSKSGLPKTLTDYLSFGELGARDREREINVTSFEFEQSMALISKTPLVRMVQYFM